MLESLPMPLKQHAEVRIDLARIRRNVIDIARRVGVPVWGVVKADAYGLGAPQVSRAIDEFVDGFCTFTFAEAAGLRGSAHVIKPIIILGPPPQEIPANDYREVGA